MSRIAKKKQMKNGISNAKTDETKSFNHHQIQIKTNEFIIYILLDDNRQCNKRRKHLILVKRFMNSKSGIPNEDK